MRSRPLNREWFSLEEKRRFHRGYVRRETTQCWPWGTGKSYGCFTCLGRYEGAHRVAYALQYGSVPMNQVVRHLCHWPACVNPAHLAIGTDKDNKRDDRERHINPAGERNPHSRLTDCGVVLIREMFAGGVTQTDLAKKFGVNLSTIHVIVCNRRWLHV